MSTPFDMGGPDDPTKRLPRVKTPHPPRTALSLLARIGQSLGLRIGILAGLAVSVVLAAVALVTSAAANPRNVVVVGMVFQGNVVQTIPSKGQLSSGIFHLGFFASGTIAEIDVTVGQNVAAGTMLAQLDVTPLQDALTTANARLSVDQVAYNNALLALKSAQDNQYTSDVVAQDAYNAVATPLAHQPTPTPQQLQQAQDALNNAYTTSQTAVNNAQNQADLTKSQVTVAQSQVAAAEHNLANATLRAPVAGQVAAVNGNVGETVGVTGTASNPLIVLTNLTALQVTGLVDETQIGAVQMGWPVAFTVRAFPQMAFFGTVANISPIPHPEKVGVGYDVTMAIAPQSAAQARLFPAMTVPSITITTQEAVGALLIPNVALSFAQNATQQNLLAANSGQLALQQAQQFIVNATDGALKQGKAAIVTQWQHGKLIAVPVVLGLSDGTNTVVLAGLSLNDPIVLSE